MMLIFLPGKLGRSTLLLVFVRYLEKFLLWAGQWRGLLAYQWKERLAKSGRRLAWIWNLPKKFFYALYLRRLYVPNTKDQLSDNMLVNSVKRSKSLASEYHQAVLRGDGKKISELGRRWNGLNLADQALVRRAIQMERSKSLLMKR